MGKIKKRKSGSASSLGGAEPLLYVRGNCKMKTAQAGTLESMDCLVTLEEAPAGSGVRIEISGSSAARFRSAMEKKINETLAALGAADVAATVQDNGALDVVLAARVEAAYKRLGEAK